MNESAINEEIRFVRSTITSLITFVVLLTLVFIGYLGTYNMLFFICTVCFGVIVFWFWRIALPKDLKRIKEITHHEMG